MRPSKRDVVVFELVVDGLCLFRNQPSRRRSLDVVVAQVECFLVHIAIPGQPWTAAFDIFVVEVRGSSSEVA